jgi:hypothetical protein
VAIVRRPIVYFRLRTFNPKGTHGTPTKKKRVHERLVHEAERFLKSASAAQPARQ